MQAQTLEEAMALTKKFTSKPSQSELLSLYGLYKQATVGDNTEDPPGGFDFVAAAKYNAWKSFVGKSQEDATEEYINLVNSIAPKYMYS
jgi:diazepam-binding inhibitor (GABA receptor modulator, acyl-CoA-binding protein)